MSNPLVSVIVGVYNKERFVGECLRSVLAQTYTNWELIIVDDASTDSSLAEVERAVGYDPRVRILRRTTNSGHPSVPRNNALAVAKGEILMLLDGDDVWIPKKVEIQVAWMLAHPTYRFCHARCWKVDDVGGHQHDGLLARPLRKSGRIQRIPDLGGGRRWGVCMAVRERNGVRCHSGAVGPIPGFGR